MYSFYQIMLTAATCLTYPYVVIVNIYKPTLGADVDEGVNGKPGQELFIQAVATGR